jgi:peptidoglycan-associated lipoprotein
MPQQYPRSLSYLSILALLLIIGCSPEVSRTPQSTALDWTAENPLASKGRSEGASRTASRGFSSSSLEALRTGESTATSPSSPLQDIYFDFDRYELRADARATLDANAKWLKERPAVRVEIEGHCDERGTNEYNMGLAARRAQMARDYLVSLGIDRHRLSAVGYGEELPSCTEHSESCWQKNRRDRFVIASAAPSL